MPTLEERECRTTNSRSEVAACLAAIEAEYQAAQQGMQGYAAVSAHRTITSHMETMHSHVNQLVRLVGDEDQAMVLVAARLEGADEHAS